MKNSEARLSDFNGSVENVFMRPHSWQHNLDELNEVAYRLLKRNSEYKVDLNRLETEPPKLHQIIEQIALIISKTYAERGDCFQLADDTALMMIRDLLIEHNPCIIARNRKNKLPKHLFQ